MKLTDLEKAQVLADRLRAITTARNEVEKTSTLEISFAGSPVPATKTEALNLLHALEEDLKAQLRALGVSL